MSPSAFALAVRASAIMALVVDAGPAFPYEDIHPPILAAPQEEFLVRGHDGQMKMRLSLDPRGVGAVIPAGDATNTWVDRDDPTGAWHYREWQWWKGHPWGDSCRPRYYADVQLKLPPEKSAAAVIDYRVDGFDCRQAFIMPSVVEQGAPYWDVVTTIRNATGGDVEEYAQFFACYTPLNRKRSFWYWDQADKLVLFAERHVKHLDGYVVNPAAYFLDRGAIPHCPRGGGKIVGHWRHPVMLSQASAAGWRSVVMIEAKHAASLAQGIEGGAMDYILFPGPTTPRFVDGAEFAVHIRHVMLKSPELPANRRLQELWNEFDASHEAIHQRASRL